jgi:hypothetical protein
MTTNSGRLSGVRMPPPPPRAAQKSGFFSSPLGALTLVVGAGVIGGYVLDWHKHTCESCGRRWSHLGVFNLGDEESHTCSRCGEVQWWKCGKRHVQHGSQHVVSPTPPAALPAPQPMPAIAGYAYPTALPAPQPIPTVCPVHGVPYAHALPPHASVAQYPSALPAPAPVAQYPSAPRPTAYTPPGYPPRRRLT